MHLKKAHYCNYLWKWLLQLFMEGKTESWSWEVLKCYCWERTILVHQLEMFGFRNFSHEVAFFNH